MCVDISLHSPSLRPRCFFFPISELAAFGLCFYARGWLLLWVFRSTVYLCRSFFSLAWTAFVTEWTVRPSEGGGCEGTAAVCLPLWGRGFAWALRNLRSIFPLFLPIISPPLSVRTAHLEKAGGDAVLLTFLASSLCSLEVESYSFSYL